MLDTTLVVVTCDGFNFFQKQHSVRFAVADGPDSTSQNAGVAHIAVLSVGRPLPRTVLNSARQSLKLPEISQANVRFRTYNASEINAEETETQWSAQRLRRE